MNRCNLLLLAAMLLLAASPAQASYFPSLPMMALMFVTPIVVALVPVWAMTRHLDEKTIRWRIRLIALAVFAAMFMALGYGGLVPEEWAAFPLLGLSMLASWSVAFLLVRRAK